MNIYSKSNIRREKIKIPLLNVHKIFSFKLLFVYKLTNIISGNVDDCVTVPAFERCDKNTDIEPYKCIQDLSGAPKYSLLVPGPWPFFSKAPEDKVSKRDKDKCDLTCYNINE